MKEKESYKADSFQSLLQKLDLSIYVIDKKNYELLFVNAHAHVTKNYEDYTGIPCINILII